MTQDALIIGARHIGLVPARNLARAELKALIERKNDWTGRVLFTDDWGYLGWFCDDEANRRDLIHHSKRDAKACDRNCRDIRRNCRDIRPRLMRRKLGSRSPKPVLPRLVRLSGQTAGVAGALGLPKHRMAALGNAMGRAAQAQGFSLQCAARVLRMIGESKRAADVVLDSGDELWATPDQALALWEKLFAAGQLHGLRLARSQAVNIALAQILAKPATGDSIWAEIHALREVHYEKLTMRVPVAASPFFAPARRRAKPPGIF